MTPLSGFEPAPQRFEEVEMTLFRILAVTLVAFLAALALAACGGDGDGGSETTTAETTTQPTETTAGDGGTTSTTSVEMDEYAFDPETVTVKRGDTIEVQNAGAIAHNLKVEQGPDPKEKSKELAGTSTFLPDKSEKLEVDVKPGEYVMVCTVAGHRELGMVGTFTVR